MYQKTQDMIQFKRKVKTSEEITSEYIHSEVYDIDVDSSSHLAKEIFQELHNFAFADFAQQMNSGINYDLAYNDNQSILARAKAIQKVHRTIFGNKYKENKDQIGFAAQSINQGDSYIPTSSPALNNFMLGWSKKFPCSFVGRSSHGKSTFMTQEGIHKVLKELVDEVHVIAPEEPSEVFWRRIFAATFKIPISAMRSGTVKISQQQVDHVKKLYENKIKVHNDALKFRDIIDLLFSLKGSHFTWIDHINAIEYPGNGTSLQNMIGGIPGLIAYEKQYMLDNPEAIIVNLTQANEKVIMSESGYWKQPKYSHAYCSQVLHQASREFLSLYYPYKDSVNFPTEWVGKRDPHSPTDMFMSIEKSSFGDVSRIHFKYDPEFGTFKDAPDTGKGNIILPEDDPVLNFDFAGV